MELQDLDKISPENIKNITFSNYSVGQTVSFRIGNMSGYGEIYAISYTVGKVLYSLIVSTGIEDSSMKGTQIGIMNGLVWLDGKAYYRLTMVDSIFIIGEGQ